MYAEASYFPDAETGKRHHFQHIADFQEHERHKNKATKLNKAFHSERRRNGRAVLRLIPGGSQ